MTVSRSRSAWVERKTLEPLADRGEVVIKWQATLGMSAETSLSRRGASLSKV